MTLHGTLSISAALRPAVVALLAIWMGNSCGWPAAAAEPGACPIQLVDATPKSGITFRHTRGGSGRQYIVEFMLGGLATLDYDGDRLIDMFLLNGMPLKGSAATPTRPALYRNQGGGRFIDVTEQAGLARPSYGMGVTAGDYDNDGDQDLYLSNFGPNVLFCNNGDGTFTDVTASARVDRGHLVGAGVGFVDIDADGNLDLFAANYVDFTYERHANAAPRRFPFPPGPQDFPSLAANVFRNRGDGTFTDDSRTSRVAELAGRGMGLVCGDFDDDGDADVLVANDAMANFFFAGGRGQFEERGVVAGLAYDGRGEAMGNMGVECGDYDNDGLVDLLVTTYTGQMPVLYRNLGRGTFADVTRRTQAGTKTFPHVNWGAALVDFDHDGDRDLFLANGHFLEDIQKTDSRTAFRVANTLCLNQGGATFRDVSDRAGSGLAVVESSRGAAFDDLDNDGDVDGVVLNVETLATVLENRSPAGGHWIQILLCGVTCNRDAVGARVRVTAGGKSQVALVHSGRGYQSHFGTRLHFGLGPQERVERIEVRWPGGGSEAFRDLTADRLFVLTEGTGERLP
jgi:hypothetical protein